MKKPKFSFGEGGFQGFAARHVEKAVLLAVVLVMGLLIYQGYKLEGLTASDPVQTPDKLREMVTQAGNRISDASSWEKIKPTREVTMDVPKEVDQRFLRKTAPEPYRLLLAWDRPLFPKQSPRVDPKIYAPEGLRVVMMQGPVAYLYDEKEGDQLTDLPASTGSNLKEKPKKKKKEAQPPPGSMPDMGMSGSGYPRAKKGGRKPDLLSSPMGEVMPENMPGSDMGSMMGSGMMGSGAGPQLGKDSELIGYRPTRDAVSKSVRAAVITAVVPFEKQEEAFLDALSNAQGFDPMRDLPNYLTFVVNRADVTDDPNADPETLKWVRLKSPQALKVFAEQNFDGIPEEVLEVDYLDDNLTTPAYPFMMRDLTSILTYPDIPRFNPNPVVVDTTSGRRKRGSGDKSEEPEGPMDGIGIDPMGGLSQQPGMNYGGSGGQTGQRPRSTFKGHKSRSGSGGGMGMNMGSGAMPMGGSAEMGMGSGMGGMGYGGVGNEQLPPPKYKLIRFTDDTIVPDRVYRYRVKVYLEDPNRPRLPEMAPAIETLDEAVKDRIKTLDAAEEKSGRRTKFYVESEWSAPSDPVSLPKRDWFYASSVTPVVMQSFDPGRLPAIPVKEPTAEVLVRVWDEAYSVDVPAKASDLVRGSPLTFIRTADVVHPVTTEIKEIPGYKFRTDSVVVDISGGETIPAATKQNDKPKSAPGEVLIVDGHGRLVVQNEVEDIDSLKRFAIDEEALAAQQPGGAAGAMDPMGMPAPAPMGTQRGRGKTRQP
jgi:hypothetical protein